CLPISIYGYTPLVRIVRGWLDARLPEPIASPSEPLRCGANCGADLKKPANPYAATGQNGEGGIRTHGTVVARTTVFIRVSHSARVTAPGASVRRGKPERRKSSGFFKTTTLGIVAAPRRDRARSWRDALRS